MRSFIWKENYNDIVYQYSTKPWLLHVTGRLIMMIHHQSNRWLDILIIFNLHIILRVIWRWSSTDCFPFLSLFQRGKFSPRLKDLIQMNTPRLCMTETKKAFRALLKKEDLPSAIQALCNLKGVGPAMASSKHTLPIYFFYFLTMAYLMSLFGSLLTLQWCVFESSMTLFEFFKGSLIRYIHISRKVLLILFATYIWNIIRLLAIPMW